jgi:hypothetical protein
MDFNRPYKTNLKELLNGGTRSFLMSELFMDSPLVSVYKIYIINGAEASLRKLDEYPLPLNRRIEILRMLSSDLIIIKHDFNAYPFLARLVKSDSDWKPDGFLQSVNALALFCLHKEKDALDILNSYLTTHPDNKLMYDLLNQIQGVFDKDSNVKFELEGYEKAQFVFVDGFDDPNLNHFLIQKNGKWIGEFKVSPEAYQYIFIIDGKRVLDPNNSDIVKDKSGIDFNNIVVKK